MVKFVFVILLFRSFRLFWFLRLFQFASDDDDEFASGLMAGEVGECFGHGAPDHLLVNLRDLAAHGYGSFLAEDLGKLL